MPVAGLQGKRLMQPELSFPLHLYRFEFLESSAMILA